VHGYAPLALFSELLSPLPDLSWIAALLRMTLVHFLIELAVLLSRTVVAVHSSVSLSS